MARTKKRFLAGLLALVMAVSLLPAGALAEDLPSEPNPAAASTDEGLPYYLMITHALDVDGLVYGKTETVSLSEEDFADGAYNFRRNAIEREGMSVLRGSWLDNQSYDLVEGWAVAKDAFEMGGDPSDGSAYYAMQLLIEYGVATAYAAATPP